MSLPVRFAALVLSGAVLAGCGGGSDTSSTASTETGQQTATGNQAPPSAESAAAAGGKLPAAALGGSPATEATVGAAYRFAVELQSSATGFAYSIANKPAWASFDTSTGVLTGTPAVADLGNYPGIVITASNGTNNASLAPFAIAVVQAKVAMQSITLSWTPPTQNTDGSSLSDLGGYYVYQGSSPDSLERTHQITNPGLTAYTIGNLATGTHYFSISAYTVSGVEGNQSGVASKTIM